jgi:hypothetical protein
LKNKNFRKQTDYLRTDISNPASHHYALDAVPGINGGLQADPVTNGIYKTVGSICAFRPNFTYPNEETNDVSFSCQR